MGRRCHCTPQTAPGPGRDSSFTHIVVTFGGDCLTVCARILISAVPGAKLTMLGIYFVDGGQHLEHQCSLTTPSPG